VVKMARCARATGARHILDEDPRLARDVPAEVIRDSPCVEIEASAGGIAGDQRDRPILVEIRHRVGACGRRGQRRQRGDARGDREESPKSPKFRHDPTRSTKVATQTSHFSSGSCKGRAAAASYLAGACAWVCTFMLTSWVGDCVSSSMPQLFT